MRLKSAIHPVGLVCLSIAGLIAADNKTALHVKPAVDYENAQKTGGVIIAAEALTTDEQTKLAFAKLNPNDYGVLPVLVVISNQSAKTIRLDRMRVDYITSDRQTVESIRPSEVRFVNSPSRPKIGPSYPIPGLGRNRKNPLDVPEIEGRAFAAKMLPAGEQAHGFFYFQASPRPGSKLYVVGIEEAATGSELFYVEIPLNANQ